MTNNENLLHNPNSIPPFAALRAFEAVFRTGGIRRAADSLGLSHAVVSRHIRLLEDWLGEPLITRAGNRLALTNAGTIYHGRVSAALVELSLATNEFRGRHDSGHLMLHCVNGLAIQWLSGQLAQFELEHPKFTIELRPSDVSPNLLLHEADVDIRYIRDDDSPKSNIRGLKLFELARPKVMPVARPDIAQRLNHAANASSLLEEILLHEDNHWEWQKWFNLNGVNTAGPLPGLMCWHAHLAIAAARLGRGVALSNEFLVAADLERGDLVEIKFDRSERVELGSYTLFAREDRWSLPALSSLRKFLRSQAQSHSAV